jgi:hypothetical protein
VVGSAAGKVAVKVASKVAPKVAGAVKAAVAKAKAAVHARNSGPPLVFSQTTASPFFHMKGSFAGRTIGGLASELRSGTLSPGDVPVGFVVLEGNCLIVNTRSSLALTRAGIPRSEWKLQDLTATETKNIQDRLVRNKLTAQGTDALRITHAGDEASNLK